MSLVLTLQTLFEMKLLIFLATFSFGFSAFGGFTCADLFANSEVGFSKEEAGIFKQAREAGFTVNAMKGQVSGRTVTVVFLGESHINSGAQIAVGAKVRGLFPTRGLEGANSENYWFPNFINKAFKSIFELYESMRAEKKLEGSNIHEAYNDDNLSLEPSIEKFDVPVINIPLETIRFGNKPSWKEKILALNFAASTLASLKGKKIALLSLVLGCGGLVCDGSVAAAAPALVGLGSGVLMYGAVAGNSGAAFRSESNKFMVANLMSGLKHYYYRDSILVMVGSSHVIGMQQILKDQHGFRLIDLE